MQIWTHNWPFFDMFLLIVIYTRARIQINDIDIDKVNVPKRWTLCLMTVDSFEFWHQRLNNGNEGKKGGKKKYENLVVSATN